MDWPTLSIFAALLTAWGAILLLAVRWMLGQFRDDLNGKLDTLKGERRKDTAKLSELERELLELKAALPERYVAREDWIRFGGVIDAKIDALHAKIDYLRERALEDGPR